MIHKAIARKSLEKWLTKTKDILHAKVEQQAKEVSKNNAF
jgi:hypothetical protein